MGFVVYDIETSGLNTRFDQILQFAAVHTDDELNIVDSIDLRSRLRPNVIPAPQALYVTGLDYEDLVHDKLPSHYSMVCKIHATLLKWSPTTFLGFNSIKFDEEFLRQAFYQCLHPIFLTNMNGNIRGDVLRLARAVATLNPDVLAAPLDQAGRKVFRLSELARVNGFDTTRTHNAMSDVEVTLGICRLIRERAPDLWSNFNRFANRGVAHDFVRDEEAFGVFQSYRGHQDVHCVTAVGISPADRNVHYCIDLTCDIDSLRHMSHEELIARLKADPRPIHKVKINAAPLLCPLWELGPAQLGDFTEDDLTREANRIRSDPDFQKRITDAAIASEPVYPEHMHVEQQIYGGEFIQEDQWSICKEFHAAPWEKRLEIAGRLSDARLRRLSKRLFLFERPDLLHEQQRAEWQAEVERRLCGADDVPWLTIPAALSQLDELHLDPTVHLDIAMMARFRDHLTARLERSNPVAV